MRDIGPKARAGQRPRLIRPDPGAGLGIPR
jgi:hypothetical protein